MKKPQKRIIERAIKAEKKKGEANKPLSSALAKQGKSMRKAIKPELDELRNAIEGKSVKALSTHNAKSLIGPRSKSAERSNERNAKRVPAKRSKSKIEDNPEGYHIDVIHNDTADFEEEATEDQLEKISKAAFHAVALQKQIDDLEAAVANLKTDRDIVVNKTLPGLMDSAHMTSFDLDDGSSIEIKDVVSGTLPSPDKKPEERKAALAWLMKHGGKGLIKTKFNTEFGVGQEAAVRHFESLIKKAGFLAKKDTGVHPQTLCAFVRELMEKGKAVPIETLGIYVGRHAKINLSDEALKKAEEERVKPKKGVRQ